jgi:hypothetical protein
MRSVMKLLPNLGLKNRESVRQEVVAPHSRRPTKVERVSLGRVRERSTTEHKRWPMELEVLRGL